MDEKFWNSINEIVNVKAESIIGGEMIQGGHNGPYYDTERAGRNIAHWINIFTDYYYYTNDEKYKRCVKLLSEYFLRGTDKADCGVYYCREKRGSGNYINGTIGSAWLIEGMVSAYKVLQRKELLNEAIKLFKQFPFDKNNGMWEMKEITGENIGLDITYNHQLWLAAAGAEVLDFVDDPEIRESINLFLDKSSETLFVMPTGVICHFANCYTKKAQMLKNKLKYIRHAAEIRVDRASLEYKEIGYHMFNLYGFAIIYRRFSKHRFFRTEKFLKALNYITKEDYLHKLYQYNADKDGTGLTCKYTDRLINTYAFPYNSPAFELPYVCECFKLNNLEEQKAVMMKYQFANTFDEAKCSFSRNTEDSEVLTARLYELTKSEWFWEGRRGE